MYCLNQNSINNNAVFFARLQFFFYTGNCNDLFVGVCKIPEYNVTFFGSKIILFETSLLEKLLPILKKSIPVPDFFI